MELRKACWEAHAILLDQGHLSGALTRGWHSGRVRGRARERKTGKEGKRTIFCLKLRIQQLELMLFIYAIPTGLAIVYLNIRYV